MDGWCCELPEEATARLGWTEERFRL